MICKQLIKKVLNVFSLSLFSVHVAANAELAPAVEKVAEAPLSAQAVSAPVEELALADTAAARLLALVLNAYIPDVLHDEKSVPWIGGERSLLIKKAGVPQLDSDARRIVATLPLSVVLHGAINRKAGFIKLQANCSADFSMPAVIALTVDFSKKPLAVESSINVEVPPVKADCNGYTLDIQQAIIAVVAQKKEQWQTDLQQQVADGLMVLGL